MKIVHVSTGLATGGAEAVLTTLIAADPKNAHVVVGLTQPGEALERLRSGGVDSEDLGWPRGGVSPAAFGRLRALIRDARPDVVQTWMYHADLVGGLAARSVGAVPIIWGVHNGDLSVSRTSRSTRVVARTCAVLSRIIPARIVCSSPAALSVHAALGYDRRRMTVIENGIALDAFAEDPAARRRQRMHWRVAEDEVVIGMVARWDPQKDHCNLLQALSQVHAERWRAVLVGPGMDTGNANLMGTIAACGLTGRVLPVGPSADMPGVMNGLDLHVLSSAGESFGNVTAEAMACGTPAVVTSVGAGPRLVGEYGWVVPPRDAPALAGAVSSALAAMSNREAWQIRREASRRRIRDHFGADVMARSYNEVWRAAAGSR